MKAMFGVVSLLVALAIVGLLAARQLRTVAPSIAPGASAPAAEGVPSFAGSGTVREQSQQLQQKVQSDVVKALEQGAAARSEPVEK
jgi:ABC-type phosphate transport system substrate-binding protein